MEILFKTIHGSRLYGLHHENSDYDYYTVVDRVPKRKATYSTHSIVDGVDSVVVDFGTWMMLCDKGVPQALEAMFSQKAEVDKIADFRRGFRVGTSVIETFLRTIKGISDDDVKHKRHMIRLAFAVQDIREMGRFSPTLTPLRIELANELAKLPLQYVYDDALTIAWQ